MTEKSSLEVSGRGGGIRTRDPLHPMQVRYQAALRPEQTWNFTDISRNVKRIP